MHIEFDSAKNDLNVLRRGLSFELVAEFDFETALFLVDDRREYGERRHVALGRLGTRLHVLCFTEIEGGIRVTASARRHSREVARYAKVQAAD